jgi:hypothetical protein
MYNETTLYDIYKKTMVSLLQGDNKTPGYNLIASNPLKTRGF